MSIRALVLAAGSMLMTILASGDLLAQGYPAPQEGVYVARDVRFHSGEVLSDVKLAYRTIGDPKNEAVIVLHGTTGSSASMLTPAFAGQLFGPGQPLDATKYFIVLPDAIGHGKSSKPSDGLRAKFPRYTYDDMVALQHLTVTQGVGVKRARMIIGNSMGGMNVWGWGVAYPDFADVLVPMAAQPTEMSSRNWMMRRLIIDSIKADPDYNGGNYTTQPKSLRAANVFFAIATNGGTLAYQKAAPTRAAADRLLDERLAAAPPPDANDALYQWDSSRDYNPAPGLEKITAHLLAINAADDERNPPETGLMVEALKRVKNGKLLLIPASPETRGHGTTGFAKFYAESLREVLATAPKRAM